MKKIPSAPIPPPAAGIVTSRHPKEAGISGLVDSKNFVSRDGHVQRRDGSEIIAYPDDQNGEAVTAIASFDYQNAGDVVRDNLVTVTDSSVFVYDSAIENKYEASPSSADWSWGGVYGYGDTPGETLVEVDAFSINFDNIDWTKFNSGNVDAVLIRLSFALATVNGIVVDAFYVNGIGGTPSTTKVTVKIPSDFYINSSLSNIMSYLRISKQEDLGVQIPILTSSDQETGITFTVNKVWNDLYDHYKASGGASPFDYDSFLFFYSAAFRASEWGLPGQSSVVDVDVSDRPVMRAWDFDQITHVLIAAKDKFLLDFDMDMTTTPTPDPSISACGSVAKAPRAAAIGIAGQRIIAGNVSYMDVAKSIELIDLPTTGDFTEIVTADLHSLHGNEVFSYFPDAVVFSGTVLTGGHRFWYPGDIIRLADSPGEIVAIQEMGLQTAAVYKTDAIYTLTVQSGISPFAPNLSATGIDGPVGPRAVVAISDTNHLYLGRDGGLYLFNGGAPALISEDIRAWIAGDIDPEYSERSFLVYDTEKKEIHVYYPTRGSVGGVSSGMILAISEEPFTGWPVTYRSIYENANLVSNPGFETAGAGGDDKFSDWSEYFKVGMTQIGTITRASDYAHEGTYSCKIANYAGLAFVYQNMVTVASTNYKLSFWSRQAAGQRSFYSVYDQSNGAFIKSDTMIVGTGGWQETTLEFQTPVGCVDVLLRLMGSNQYANYPTNTVWFDDVTLSVTPSGEVNVLCGCMHFRGGQPIRTGDLRSPAPTITGATETKYQELLIGVSGVPIDDYSDSCEGLAVMSDSMACDFYDSSEGVGFEIGAHMETGLTDLGDPDGQKVLVECELILDPGVGYDVDGEEETITVTVFGGNSDTSVSQLFQGDVVISGSPPYIFQPRVKARYFSFKIEHSINETDDVGKFKYGGMIVRFKPAGFRYGG